MVLHEMKTFIERNPECYCRRYNQVIQINPTLVVVVATGILTSVIGPTLLKWLKIDDPVAAGLALGGTGHAVGTGTAFRYGSVAGAMAGLAIGVTGLLYVFISPIVAGLKLS